MPLIQIRKHSAADEHMRLILRANVSVPSRPLTEAAESEINAQKKV